LVNIYYGIYFANMTLLNIQSLAIAGTISTIQYYSFAGAIWTLFFTGSVMVASIIGLVVLGVSVWARNRMFRSNHSGFKKVNNFLYGDPANTKTWFNFGLVWLSRLLAVAIGLTLLFGLPYLSWGEGATLAVDLGFVSGSVQTSFAVLHAVGTFLSTLLIAAQIYVVLRWLIPDGALLLTTMLAQYVEVLFGSRSWQNITAEMPEGYRASDWGTSCADLACTLSFDKIENYMFHTTHLADWSSEPSGLKQA